MPLDQASSVMSMVRFADRATAIAAHFRVCVPRGTRQCGTVRPDRRCGRLFHHQALGEGITIRILRAFLTLRRRARRIRDGRERCRSRRERRNSQLFLAVPHCSFPFLRHDPPASDVARLPQRVSPPMVGLVCIERSRQRASVTMAIRNRTNTANVATALSVGVCRVIDLQRQFGDDNAQEHLRDRDHRRSRPRAGSTARARRGRRRTAAQTRRSSGSFRRRRRQRASDQARTTDRTFRWRRRRRAPRCSWSGERRFRQQPEHNRKQEYEGKMTRHAR